MRRRRGHGWPRRRCDRQQKLVGVGAVIDHVRGVLGAKVGCDEHSCQQSPRPSGVCEASKTSGLSIDISFSSIIHYTHPPTGLHRLLISLVANSVRCKKAVRNTCFIHRKYYNVLVPLHPYVPFSWTPSGFGSETTRSAHDTHFL